MQEAAKREVEEESGLTFEPESVIAVECLSKAWIRVTLSGTYQYHFHGHNCHTYKHTDIRESDWREPENHSTG